MNIVRNISIVIIVVGIFLGVRYMGSSIHYGCSPEPIVNVEGGDDCPPPFVLVGKLGYYLTGGPYLPLWNRDATTVRTVRWSIEKADPSIVSEEDFRFYEQKIAADVTTYDGKTKRYDLGTAHGCTGTTTNELQDHTLLLGSVDCYFALSSVKFSASKRSDGFYIERYDESAKDGSIATTTLVRI